MDVTQLILDDHHEQRRLFGIINQTEPSDTEALSAVWQRLKALLDTHAEAEERFFYPKLLAVGKGAVDSDSAQDETLDAIKDHNEIRDAGEAVEGHPVGSAEWFKAVDEADRVNSKHMAEEERQGLNDFRRHASLEERHALGVKFIAFECQHLTGVTPRDKDPKQYVSEHQEA